MKEIKPTKQEVFAELRRAGCCWLVGMGKGCECYSRQLVHCYAEAEKRLTRYELTAEEIKEAQEANTKAILKLDACMAYIGGDITENEFNKILEDYNENN